MKKLIVIIVIVLMLLGNLVLSAWTYHTMTNFTVHCYLIESDVSGQSGTSQNWVMKETCQDNPLPQEP